METLCGGASGGVYLTWNRADPSIRTAAIARTHVSFHTEGSGNLKQSVKSDSSDQYLLGTNRGFDLSVSESQDGSHSQPVIRVGKV